MSERRYMTMDQAADYLQINRTTLWRRMSEGKIAFYREGGRRLFKKADLDAYMDRNLQNKEAAANA